jgi:hypothetical protein
MVYLDVTIQNNSSWIFTYARHNDIDGYTTESVTSAGHVIRSGDDKVIRLKPKSGFMGVETGVGAEFELDRSDGKQIKFFVKVPACGEDTYSVTRNNTLVNGVKWHNAGKGGSDNQHNVTLTIEDGGYLQAKMVNKDATLDEATAIAKEAVKIAVQAAVAAV